MTVHRFPTTLPSDEAVTRAKDHVVPLAMGASSEIMKAAHEIMAATGAREFASAIETLHRKLDEHCRGFATLREQTLLWWKSES